MQDVATKIGSMDIGKGINIIILIILTFSYIDMTDPLPIKATRNFLNPFLWQVSRIVSYCSAAFERNQSISWHYSFLLGYLKSILRFFYE